MPDPSWFDESPSLAGEFGGIGPAALSTTLVLYADHGIAAHLSGTVDAARLSVAIEDACAWRSEGRDANGRVHPVRTLGSTVRHPPEVSTWAW